MDGFLPVSGWVDGFAATSVDVDQVMAAPGNICWFWDSWNGTMPSGSSLTFQLWRNDQLVASPFTDFGTGSSGRGGGGAGNPACDTFPINRGDMLAIKMVYSGPTPAAPISFTASMQYLV